MLTGKLRGMGDILYKGEFKTSPPDNTFENDAHAAHSPDLAEVKGLLVGNIEMAPCPLVPTT